jgi:GSH-dependent disulfide-bond oxidoreductase
MIDLHYDDTPNCHKIVIMLNEVGLDYRIVHYTISRGDHLTPEFSSINPNLKVPAIVDHAPADNGPPLPVFESGAILQYLADKTGQFLPPDLRRRTLAIQWLTWQVAGLGPMGGQASHFVRYAPDGQEYGVKRYSRELLRLLRVLDNRLSEVDYLAEEYSIADMACWPGKAFYVVRRSMGMPELKDFPAIERWHNRIAERSAVVACMTDQRLRASPNDVVSTLDARQTLTAEQWSIFFGDRQHAAVAKIKPSSA